MAHCLILGMTESGKSTLAKRFLLDFKKAGISTIVLDPLSDPSWKADFQTKDPEEFLRVLWNSRGCAAFVDEAGENAGQYDSAMIKSATKGRHFGHSMHYISQRGTMINTTIRGQCSKLFLFATGKKDSLVHAEEWGHDGLKSANTLKRGEFFACDRFDKFSKMRVF